jgi:Ser/Thr protein kinase RdoA (MazF antagonist)
VFCLTCHRGRFALRVHRANYHSDAELASEFMWTARLNSEKLRTPQPLPTRSGALFAHASAQGVAESRNVDLLEWFDGSPMGTLEQWLECSPASLQPELEAAGRLMGIMHKEASQWTPPAGFTRCHWDEHSLLGSEPFWGRYWELEGLTNEQLARFADAKAQMLQDLAVLGKGSDRFGLVHADFLPDNLLVNGQTTCLIDFDDLGYSWYLYEMASLLFFFSTNAAFPAAVAATVRGYRKEYAMAEELVEQLPVFLLMRGLGLLGWLHERSETEAAQLLKPQAVAIVDRLAREYLS